MSADRCILCGAPLGDLAFQEGVYQALRCAPCGLIMVSPRPPPEQIRAIYEHDAAQTASRQLLAKTRAPHARAHGRHLLTLLRPHKPGGTLLEIGPGGGLFLREAAAAGYAVHGLEPNPVQATFIADEFGIACTVAALEPGALSGPFDVIVQINVLSHLPDPLASLCAMRELLADDGVLLLQTGNYGDVDPRWAPLIARTERFQLPDHLFFFGEAALRRLLERAGFEILALHRYSRVPEKTIPSLAVRLGLRFFWTWRLGALAPKAGRPQALVVLARRARSPMALAPAGEAP